MIVVHIKLYARNGKEYEHPLKMPWNALREGDTIDLRFLQEQLEQEDANDYTSEVSKSPS